MPPKAACIPTTDPSDSALIALCNEFLRRNVEILNLGSTKELSDRLFIRLARATLSQRALLADIAALPVSSLEGWRNWFKVAVAVLGAFRDFREPGCPARPRHNGRLCLADPDMTPRSTLAAAIFWVGIAGLGWALKFALVVH